MRFFGWLSLEHICYFAFPTLIFILIFAAALAYSHFGGKKEELRKTRIMYRYPDRIEDRNAPFPAAMIWIISGTVLWVVGYILSHGYFGIQI